jgi:arylformamidase
MRKSALITAAVLIMPLSSVFARDRLPQQCRSAIVTLCGTDRSTLRNCLKEQAAQLPSECKSALRERMTARTTAKDMGSSPARNTNVTEYSYGANALQKLDFYRQPTNRNAPLIIFVHGGGWENGDKSNTTGQYKAPHYNQLGYAFASINYRLLPSAPVEHQAADVASAISYLRNNAARIGFDPNNIILMGHSAGAHLVALVGTDPQYLQAAGLDFGSLRGVIPLDGAAYDVAAQMEDGSRIMKDTYQDAFGTDPIRQNALSPTLHAASPNAASFLILHVNRDDGERQSTGLAKALNLAGTPAQINAVAGKGLKGHMEINRKLGDPSYPATAIVDTWIKQRFGR